MTLTLKETWTLKAKGEDADIIRGAVLEALAEARRLNEAAGRVVFNPAATDLLVAASEILDH